MKPHQRPVPGICLFDTWEVWNTNFDITSDMSPYSWGCKQQMPWNRNSDAPPKAWSLQLHRSITLKFELHPQQTVLSTENKNKYAPCGRLNRNFLSLQWISMKDIDINMIHWHLDSSMFYCLLPLLKKKWQKIAITLQGNTNCRKIHTARLRRWENSLEYRSDPWRAVSPW